MGDPYELECPHCRQSWKVHPDDDLCYADDKRDGMVSTCDECGGKYTLTATTEVYFDTEKV